MISPKKFYDYLIKKNINFFSGVPDSLLKDICAYIDDHSRVNQHVISAEIRAVGVNLFAVCLAVPEALRSGR